MFKKALSVLLCLCLLAVPFEGIFASAATVAVSNGSAPIIYINIPHLATVSSDTAITVDVTPQSGTYVAATDIRLEGKTIGTDYLPFSFTPAGCGLADGAMYTVVIEATDSNGRVSVTPFTFFVDDGADADYTVQNGDVTANGASVALHTATPLSFTAGYGSSKDGTVGTSTRYDAANTYRLQYDGKPVEVSSASGIPYQTFDIDLGGKTSGEVAVAYNGYTKQGERMALKAYNAKTSAWDVIDTFVGEGSVSASLDVATYNDGGKIRVAAVLDYVTNGSDTMIWLTDPQHYTKFDDLNEYYYKVFDYAAKEYVAGNVGYIMTSGDLVDDRPQTTAAVTQWQVSSKAVNYVEAVDMPNGLVSGNHDVNTFESPDYSKTNTVDYSKFWETFPASRFNSERWYGGSINNNASHYDLITVGNVDFIVVFLGYGVEATDETIAWANQALRTYSHRTGIIVTHEYLDSQSAVRAESGRGEMIYQNIVDPNPNVKMVLCGHDDGSLMLEKKASDGRTFYEILSDYQFVEAEDPSFYANEHYIGKVPHCCGDGYLRLLTVEGDTLSSITYSTVTHRYNPYGDRESFSIDLDCGTADRAFATTAFSAAVVGESVAAPTGDTIGVITKNGNTTYTTVNYATVPTAPYTEETPDGIWPTTATYGVAATPAAPFYPHAATTAPTVAEKVNLLTAFGYQDRVTFNGWTPVNKDYGIEIDLKKTPYLYYSFAAPAGANFTFSFTNNMDNSPYLLFRDATGDGAFFNRGADVWDGYQNREQFATTSETGCIDLRTLTSDPANTTWTFDRFTVYTSTGMDVVFSYLFLGSAPTASTINGDSTPNDLSALSALINESKKLKTGTYTTESVNAFQAAITAAESVNKNDTKAVSDAYAALAAAKGALTKKSFVIDRNEMISLYNYSLAIGDWKDADTRLTLPNDNAWMTASQNASGGLDLSRSSLCTHTWPAIYNEVDYTIYPTGDRLYLGLEFDADSAFSIKFTASQGSLSDVVVKVNQELGNSFHNTDCDAEMGDYYGVYDITDSFLRAGFDVTSDILITYTAINLVPGPATLNRLEIFGDRAQTTAPAASLMPTSASKWAMTLDTQPAKVAVQNGNTVVENTCNSWGGMQAAVSPAQVVTTADHAISLDITVQDHANVLLFANGHDISLTKYIDAAKTNSADDIAAGDYNVIIPLADIEELYGASVTEVTAVTVYSVGANGNNAVTVRKFRLTEYIPIDPDYTAVNYGTAASPSDKYFSHAAISAPDVANKVDLLKVMRQDAPMAVTSKKMTYGNFNLGLTIDLSKTPYLYYSVSTPKKADSRFTFAFHTDMSTTPYLLFRDATKSGATLSAGADAWDSYTNGQQYFTGSETGCIDMRQYLTDTSATTMTIEQLNFYNRNTTDVTVNYMFFGSAPVYVEEFDQSKTVILGDVDDNGTITTLDARFVLEEILMGANAFTERQKLAADFDGNGILSTADVRQILLYIVNNS